MHFGFTADRFRWLSIASVLRLFRWNGLRFAEVTTAVFDDPERSIRNAGKMRLALHLPNAGNRGYDFSSKKHFRKIQSDLALIHRNRKRLPLRYAIFHPPEAEGFSGISDFFIRNLMAAEIPLVLENIRGNEPEAFFTMYQSMQKRLGHRLCGVCLDIPHAHLTSGDWKSFYRRLRPHVRVIHLSDCRDDEDRHLPFGAGGELSLMSILQFLRKEGFEGNVNFEILPPSVIGVIQLFIMIRRLNHFQ